MKIRSAKKADLPECEKLLKLSMFRFPEGGYPDVNFLEAYLDKNYFLVAEENNRIIGCIFGESIKGNMAIIWYFVVDKNQRNKGIGRKLISFFESNCKKNKIEWIILLALLNKRTLNFYMKNGFIEGKKHIEFVKKLG